MTASPGRSTMPDADSAPVTARSGGKYLTLFLGQEEYGLDVTKVQEIIRMLPITRVPRAPSFIRGVVNLRGRVVPVLELRARLGMDPVEEVRETCIVIVRSGDLTMGIIVDQVRDVLDIQAAEMHDVPDFGVSVDTTYLSCLARREQRVVLLLEVDRVLTLGESEALSSTVVTQ